MNPKIFDVPLNSIRSERLEQEIGEAIRDGRRLWVATVNTEWLMRARHDDTFRRRLLRADLRLADGSGVLWAARYLSLPWRGPLWSIWQMVYSGTSLIFFPPFCRKVLPERISGSELVPALAKISATKGWHIFLLGAAPGVAENLKQRLERNYPGLAIAASSADPGDTGVIPAIKEFQPDIIFVAYSAPEQLSWIEAHLPELPPAVGIGVGGAFDYLTGGVAVQSGARTKARPAPGLIKAVGIEWLWRLITQPWRWRRVMTAVPIFIKNVVQYRSSLHKVK